MKLFQHRIVVVTGKGGVGKTTVAAALGTAAAAAGKRTIVVETSGATRLPEIFGRPGKGYAPSRIGPRLHTLSITPEEAIEDYVVQQIRFRRLYRMVFRNRVMGPFVDAVPGLHDAIQLGKVFDLWRERDSAGALVWDLIVVDAPATGHGLTMLGSPKSLMELTRAGPLFEAVRLVHDTLTNPTATAIVLVTVPEEMPVSETIDLWRRLGTQRRQVAACVVNEMISPPGGAEGAWARVRPSVARLPGTDELVELADRQASRHARQVLLLERLARSIEAPRVPLRFRHHRDLTAADLGQMGEELVDGIGRIAEIGASAASRDARVGP